MNELSFFLIPYSGYEVSTPKVSTLDSQVITCLLICVYNLAHIKLTITSLTENCRRHNHLSLVKDRNGP